MSPGAFHTTGGLAASLILGTPYLPDPETQYAATTRAVRWLSARAVDLAQHHRDLLAAGGVGTPWHVYDTISGLAGIGRLLLAAIQSGHDVADAGLVAALRLLTKMIRTRHGERPGWWLSPEDHPHGVDVHPSGAASTGLAHGIAGPLALLAVAQTLGHSVIGQHTAIREAADWLLRWRAGNLAIWAPHVTGEELDRGVAAPVPGRGDAWCFLSALGVCGGVRVAIRPAWL